MYGEDIMKKVKGCEFHFQQSVNKHARKLKSEDIDTFKFKANSLMNASNNHSYQSEYDNLMEFLTTSGERKELIPWLNWWHAQRNNIFRAFTGADKPRANQAEVIHAGWNWFLTLMAAEFDVKDAVYLDCELEYYPNTTQSIGCGPPLFELKERRGKRELDTASKIGEDLLKFGIDKEWEELIPPPKLSRRENLDQRMFLDQKYKSDSEKHIMKVREQIIVNTMNRKCKVSNATSSKVAYDVTISNACSCTCPYHKKNRDNVYCKHMFIVLHVLNGETYSTSLQDRRFGDEDIKNLFQSAGNTVKREFL